MIRSCLYHPAIPVYVYYTTFFIERKEKARMFFLPDTLFRVFPGFTAKKLARLR